MFKKQPPLNCVKLLFQVENFIEPPVLNGDRTPSEIAHMFRKEGSLKKVSSSGSERLPYLVGDAVRLQ